MKLVCDNALIACDHPVGKVDLEAGQDFVRVDGHLVLVRDDAEGRDIDGCPNTNPGLGIRKCKTTLPVKEGYSGLLRIEGDAVCLDVLWGLTDGTPPGMVKYKVKEPGQDFVEER